MFEFTPMEGTTESQRAPRNSQVNTAYARGFRKIEISLLLRRGLCYSVVNSQGCDPELVKLDFVLRGFNAEKGNLTIERCPRRKCTGRANKVVTLCKCVHILHQ